MMDMSSFREFLEDYQAKEYQELQRFWKGLRAGKYSLESIYPPPSRFKNLKKPLAMCPPLAPVWGVVPFYGSTLIPLCPRPDQRSFDELYKVKGFTSKHLDDMIDLVKQTGRIQFILVNEPKSYENLEFLRPLFEELRPPAALSIEEAVIDKERVKEYLIEFYTLSNFGFKEILKEYILSTFYGGAKGYSSMRLQEAYLQKRINDYAYDYVRFKALGWHELADELGELMITNPIQALEIFNVLGNFSVIPFESTKAIYNFKMDYLILASNLAKKYRIEFEHGIKFPFEIGKFILNKIVRYPRTLQDYIDIMDIIKAYDQKDLYELLGALNQGVMRRDYDKIEESREALDEVLDQIWDEAKKIKSRSLMAHTVVSVMFGIIGSLASKFTGNGILSEIGFECANIFLELKFDLGTRIAKFFSPNYLVTIFDFRRKYCSR